jgi:hypothetical protein
VSEVWVPPFPVTFWRRPLSAITATIADCQFVMERIVEARPLPELAERDPATYRELASEPFFLHMRLRPLQPDGSVAPALRPLVAGS